MSTQLLVRMLDKQLEFLGRPEKWAAARGGVGSGKTMAMVWWMLRRLEQFPEANHVVVGADYEQLRRGFFQSFLAVLDEDLGWEVGRDYTYRENPTPLVRFAHNGARLRSMSAELAQRVRSAEFQSIYCEEPQTWHNGNGAETFRAVANRLRHSRRSAILYPGAMLQGRLTFNPPAVGTWLYRLIEEQWKEPGFPCLTFSLRDNKLLRGLNDYIKQIESMYPPEAWPTEIDGEWFVLGGTVYKYYNADRHAKPLDGLPPLAFDPLRPLLWTLDFNVKYMCSVVAQVHHQPVDVADFEDPPPNRVGVGMRRQILRRRNVKAQEHLVYALDELRIRDASVYDVVAAFLRKWGPQARSVGVTLYGDPAGRHRSQATLDKNWDVVVTQLRSAGVSVQMCVPEAAPLVDARVNATNAQFVSGDGIGCFIDHARCPNLVRDFQQVAWREGAVKTAIDKRNEELTHLSDAWGYLVAYERVRWAMAQRQPGGQNWKSR